MKRWCWAMLAALGMLGGCTTLPPLSAPPQAQAYIPSFELSGRISVRHEGDGFSGNLHWRHVLDEDEFVVQTPFGQGVARVTQNAQGATLQMADGQVLHAPDAESLTQQALGFRLPLGGLPHWVQAQAVSGDAVMRHNADGTVSFLNEQGWNIEYLAYQTLGQAGGASVLPGKVFMENTDLKLRLIIDDWQAPAP